MFFGRQFFEGGAEISDPILWTRDTIEHVSKTEEPADARDFI